MRVENRSSKPGTLIDSTSQNEVVSIKRRVRNFAGAIMIGTGSLLTGCSSEADVASRNVSQAADQFEVNRRVVVYNGITDKVVMIMEGRCSLGNNETADKRSVTCKTGSRTYLKHIFQLSDNMFLYAEQLEETQASGYYYRRIFTPQQVIPDIDLRGNFNELPGDRR